VQPLFSIIVPTYNRPHQLRRCLDALAAQDFDPESFEVIVADDGSRTPLRRVVAPFSGLIRISLIEGRHAGRSAACNAGARAAQGACLAFTDDDCLPAPDWLTRLSSRLGPSSRHAVCGRVRNALPQNLFSSASQLLVSYLYQYYNRNPARARFGTGNNLAVPAAVFEELGGFALRLSLIGGAEDREFIDRWIARGHPLIYAPEVVVHHAHQLKLRSFLRQHYNYGRGAYHFRRLHWTRTRQQVAIEPQSFYAGMIRYPFREPGRARAAVATALLAAAQMSYVTGHFREKLKCIRA
jgi:glycosyltransferase involved in cell wall biosynthesis